MTNITTCSDQAAILDGVDRFIDREVAPRVAGLERDERFPEDLVDGMRALGLFGMAIPEEQGGLGLDIELIAAIIESVAKGWTTLAAYLNSHTTVCHVLTVYGTATQKDRYLPNLAKGRPRAALCLTEPHAGSDLQAIRTYAVKSDDGFDVTGGKVFVTNGQRAGLLLVLVKTNPEAEPAHRGISLFLIDSETPGLVVGGRFEKMAYNLVDTCEIAFDRVRVGTESLLGGVPGRGMAQLLDGLEVGRIEIAASAVGLGQAALDLAINYAKERVTFGKPIAEHQAIRLELASMATKLMAARSLTREAAREKSQAGRADKLCSMAKLFASEAAMEIAASALRIHGGYGYIKGYAVERLFREAPLYVVGEGTNEIQKLVIARRLLDDKG